MKNETYLVNVLGLELLGARVVDILHVGVEIE